jgi:hypothetical protein
VVFGVKVSRCVPNNNSGNYSRSLSTLSNRKNIQTGMVWFVSSKHGPALQGGWGRGAVQVTFEDGSPITWDGDPIR